MPQTLERKLMSWCFLIAIEQRISGDASPISGWQSHVLKRSYNKRLILLVTGHHVPKLGKTKYWQIQSHRSLIRQKRVFFNKVFKMRFCTGASLASQHRWSFLGVFQGCFLFIGSAGNFLLYIHSPLPSLLCLSSCAVLLLGLPRITSPVLILGLTSGDHSRTVYIQQRKILKS